MKRNERAFFDTVYSDVFPVLYRVVLRIVGDRESAEEVCHDAFVRFYQHSLKLPDEQQARYWLLRVGKNLAYNLSKRRGREQRAYQRAYHEPSRGEERTEDSALRDETREQVRAALEKLPRTLRDVIILKEYGDLAYAEIARTLGISVANVKVRAYRARVQLSQLLEVDDVHLPE
jgi:RNA polymerase sigma-70 factor (ECF subfamily)